MGNIPLRLRESESAIRTSDLLRYSDGWIMAGEIARHSERTSANRRLIVKNFFWFLRREGYETCGVTELRAFFVYINRGHKDPGGRWGNPQMTAPVKDRTVKDYHGSLRTLFRWIIAEGGLDSSPMERIPVPVDRPDTIQPLTEEQVLQFRTAARNSRQSLRDEAIVAFLVDTGVRASELCGLRFSDFDITAKRATVEGKGGKSRPVYFGRITARALWQYLRADGREPEEPLFQSERGEALTRSGLLQLIDRLAKDARISGVRFSPHTFRHTFAINFLRNGGNQFSLMSLLGHTNLQMTARPFLVPAVEGAADELYRKIAECLKDDKKKDKKDDKQENSEEGESGAAEGAEGASGAAEGITAGAEGALEGIAAGAESAAIEAAPLLLL